MYFYMCILAPIEEKYNVFNNCLRYYLGLSFPIKMTKISKQATKKKSWINDEFKVEKKKL